jgi:probable rRNA maturation factor
MTPSARPKLAIDVRVDSGLWKEPAKIKSAIRRAVAEAAIAASTGDAELAIVLTDDSAIRLLNRRWRGIDRATNVLSFPTNDLGGSPRHLGDIVLAFETIEREAQAEHKPFLHHVAHLTVHGFLHLLGYDHERDDDAERMEGAERQILRQLAIPDPHARRATSVKQVSAKSASRSRRSSN